VLAICNDSSIGIVAPLLLFETAQVQRSVKKFPTFFEKMSKVMGGRSRGHGGALGNDHYAGFPWQKERAIDSAISAFWLFRRDLLGLVGYLDENIFYSPEDLDYCLRVWKAGKKVIFSPAMVVEHKTQQISHRSPVSYIALSHLFGLLYYYRKHRYFFSRKRLYAALRPNHEETVHI